MFRLIIIVLGFAGGVQAQEIETPFLGCDFGDTTFQLAEYGDEFAWLGESIATTGQLQQGNGFGAVTAYPLGLGYGPQILVVYSGEGIAPDNAPPPGTGVLITVVITENGKLEVKSENGECEQLD